MELVGVRLPGDRLGVVGSGGGIQAVPVAFAGPSLSGAWRSSLDPWWPVRVVGSIRAGKLRVRSIRLARCSSPATHRDGAPSGMTVAELIATDPDAPSCDRATGGPEPRQMRGFLREAWGQFRHLVFFEEPGRNQRLGTRWTVVQQPMRPTAFAASPPIDADGLRRALEAGEPSPWAGRIDLDLTQPGGVVDVPAGRVSPWITVEAVPASGRRLWVTRVVDIEDTVPPDPAAPQGSRRIGIDPTRGLVVSQRMGALRPPPAAPAHLRIPEGADDLGTRGAHVPATAAQHSRARASIQAPPAARPRRPPLPERPRFGGDDEGGADAPRRGGGGGSVPPDMPGPATPDPRPRPPAEPKRPRPPRKPNDDAPPVRPDRPGGGGTPPPADDPGSTTGPTPVAPSGLNRIGLALGLGLVLWLASRRG